MTAPVVHAGKWRKSSRSSASGSNCVEVAELTDALAVRDSKDPEGPALLFDRDAWSSFVVGLRRGPLD
ncbi:hypothetical protein C5N14_20345 [Micromonospora sp. MW-13]|uniref:DUF397 domain-containing protein n=1 Tax=unclassified Micromonospora TaxID=2617518 RepID=UPI000E443944|nr:MULTISPECIES: DUF397 domain-containing protein [unclassified Micromonospora]MCX4471128.1 DUF397 domain-containing protein [Micromonospora sp. NBC_01655]RGC67149.1 hypothetical protein C5N14_20345 [Micromonospora sp. MW-13]